MSAVLHMTAFNSIPHGPAFTSVNGRSSLSPTEDQKPPIAARSTTWTPLSRGPENGYHSPDSVTSASTVSSGDRSPTSPKNNKRRRSASAEDKYAVRSPEQIPVGSRQLPRPFQLNSMENPQQRSQADPMTRPECDRRWATEPRELPQQHYSHPDFQHREPRPTEPVQNIKSSVTDDRDSPEQEDTNATEVTRAGVQVELKKRKRQFANRTKTGCGTCRRRKKKCDEAKPECNNCTRGGFICEGYANKIPWPKNGATKLQPPPLQAKERPSVEIPNTYGDRAHIPHPEAPRSTEYSYPPKNELSNGHEQKPQAPATWNPSPPSRIMYQSEAQLPPPHSLYTQPTTVHHERSRSHDRQAAPPQQSQPPPQHNPRMYHHTPQSMGHVVAGTAAPAPVMAAKPAAQQHHVAQQHTRPPPPPPPTTAPPGRSPTRYAQPLSMVSKTEKDKMLAGEPFLPFHTILIDERQQCAGAVHQFNSTANAAVHIAEKTRDEHFRTILKARWISPRYNTQNVGSHLGNNFHVTVPFHCDYGYHLNIGDNVVIGSDAHLHDSAKICIGRNTKIGVRVTIQTLKTPTDNQSIKGSTGREIAQEVLIGENVYIGDNCVIEAGVKIGPNTIVRPGSVVSRDLPSNCVAQGNPAFPLPN